MRRGLQETLAETDWLGKIYRWHYVGWTNSCDARGIHPREEDATCGMEFIV